jgi:hypothetical protein
MGFRWGESMYGVVGVGLGLVSVVGSQCSQCRATRRTAMDDVVFQSQ